MEIFKTKPLPQPRPYRGLIIVLIVLLLGVLIYLAIKIVNSNQGTSVTATATATIAPETSTTPAAKIIIPTKTTTATQSGQGMDEEAINGSKIVAQYFMNARIDRSLEEARPYVTENFLSDNTQDGFAGTSSPSMDNYEIQDVSIVSSGKKYRVSIKTNWLLNGQDAGSTIWTIDVVNENDQFLVDSYATSQ